MGLTAERQAFRERVRMEAVAMFAAGRGGTDIAKELRVSVRSAQRWRQAWQETGQDGVRSRGPASRPKLSETLFAVLEEELVKGPAAQGWPDQRWTLARIKTLIGRRFHKSMTPPASRTWSRRGSTPVIRVRARSQRRFSIAALCCCKPGERPRWRPFSSMRSRSAAGSPREACRRCPQWAEPRP
ncbi:helix-turn-helix domain-containing protein [Streptomyces sp. NPDC090741]|uniref:helix-turn-helix domain-containing protein n=1 Tax=Streptomyces sp. NPDC090741 TaxID=3365967 RepID=UPI00382FEC0F